MVKEDVKREWGKWFSKRQTMFVDFVYNFLEVHLVKLVAFTIMLHCCETSDALHMLVVLILLLCTILGSWALESSFYFIGPYLAILFLTTMTYQTRFIPELKYNVDCSKVNISFSSIMERTILDPLWWGFEHLTVNEVFITHRKTYVVVLISMTLEKVVRMRQKNKRFREELFMPHPFVMYPKTTRVDADKTFKDFVKFLFNYGFYKFGVEVTLTYCIFVISYRKDAFSILYGLWVLILIMLKRTSIIILWPFFLMTVFITILWQYSVVVGLSKKACFGYPWGNEIVLIKWLFLPNFENILNSYKILVDFVLLVLIQRQQFVFDIERKYKEKYPGGSNKEDYINYRNPDFVNPFQQHYSDRYPNNYSTNLHRWIDVAQLLFMSWFYRITLMLLLWNGADDVHVLSLGYLVGAFVFLWIDFDLCLWKIEKVITWWNTLLLFITIIIVGRTGLQFYGCIYGEEIENVLKIFIGPFWAECCGPYPAVQSYSTYWDTVCFFFVILQRRYFKSCYFLNEVEEVEGIFKLQSKGAKLMIKIQELRVKAFQEKSAKTLMKIKKNMKRIKDWQQRMQGLNYKEPKDHETAIYMGDYFMFEDIGGESHVKLPINSSSDDDDSLDEEKHKSGLKKDDPKEIKQRRRRAVEVPLSDEKQGQQEEKTPNGSDIKEYTRTKVMIFLIKIFNKYSADYRYIRNVVWRKRKEINIKAENISTDRHYSSLTSFEEHLLASDDQYQDTEDYSNRPARKLWLPLFKAFFDFFMSKTEMLCYFAIFLDVSLFPNFISLALPLMVFMWGSLTILRPTSTFWTVLIAYSEVMILIKTVFQNSVFPWNSSKDLEYPPLILGVSISSGYILSDLFLLIMLFLHRYKLKTLGLWNRTHEYETKIPKDLNVYKVLKREDEFPNKRHRSWNINTKILSDSLIVISNDAPTALWKCTSRATAKLNIRGNARKTNVLVKEIEGEILVTHDGNRLQPTYNQISDMSEKDQLGNVVLRVYDVTEFKSLIYKLSWVQHITPVRKFFRQILARDWSMPADFYTFMFIFEFIDFLIIFFGYSAFADPESTNVSEYFSLIENQVPSLFLAVIILHFLIIIVDRALYLKKCLTGKLILHFVLVSVVHIWLFMVIPMVTEGVFSENLTRQLYYMISCFYFLMSAYQLRVGYPMRVQGHFLCRRYGDVNYYSYKALQLMPFFNQIRTLLDYLFTNTSMSLLEWIKMESIFEVVFENKCSRRADYYHPTPRGVKYPKVLKYWPGMFFFFALIVIIWLPILIFVLFNTIAQPNLPQRAILKVHVGNFGDIFSSVASYNDIFTFSRNQYTEFQEIFQYRKQLATFLSYYDHRDVAVLKIRQEPFQPWLITPKEFRLFKETAQNLDLPVTLYFKLVVDRIPRSQIVAHAIGYTEKVLYKGDKAREQLAKVFDDSSVVVRLNNALPKFVHITNDGEVNPLSGFLNPATATRRNVTLQLMKEDQYMWWKVTELEDDADGARLSRLPYQSYEDVVIYTLNEKNTPKLLLNIRRRGILGLYLSTVLVSWTFIKRIMTKYPKLIFEEMPDPDPVLQLCKDIYFARENEEFALEEDLYAKLLFLFRSPETMIKVTRLKN